MNGQTPQTGAARYNQDKPQLSYLLDFAPALYQFKPSDFSEYADAEVIPLIAEFAENGEGSSSHLRLAVVLVLSQLEADLSLAFSLPSPNKAADAFGAFFTTFPHAMAALAKVCEKGAVKYARGDWLKGRPVMDTLDSALRHYCGEHGYLLGNANDKESGLPHLAHVAWNLLAVLAYLKIRPEMDDRAKRVIENAE